MLPEDIEPRVTTGVHARAVANPSAHEAPRPDPIAEGLLRVLQHLADANVAAANLAAELDGSFAAGPGAPDAHRRAVALLRCVQQDVAGALADVAGLSRRR